MDKNAVPTSYDEDSEQTGSVDMQADLNLCWSHMSEGTFSHSEA